MEKNNIARAEEYYQLVGAKNVEDVKKYLSPDVTFFSPLASLKGKEAVIMATSHFMDALKSLTIRAKFGSDGQAMIVYDVDLPGVEKEFPGASLLTFEDGLIVRIELFFGKKIEK